MADGRGKEMSLGRENMNGHHNVNGGSLPRSPLPNSNGHGNAIRPGQIQSSSAKLPDKPAAMTNGEIPTNPSNTTSQRSRAKAHQVPDELMDMLKTRIPDDAYVPMARLISRASKSCWSHLIATLNELAEIQPDDPRTITRRMRPPDQHLVNDDSPENQKKKMKLWNFAEEHKRVLIKLLVILMWSSKSEDNKLTIALNYEIHTIRAAFSNANDKLSEWIVYIVSRQDACPDLGTALEVLATGRIADIPDLGFGKETSLADKHMLSTLQRLNRVLSARMVHEECLPFHMRQWHIHDGRVTFKVPQEFELDLSVMGEEPDATFMLVDVRLDFRPRPSIPDDMHDQITTITNQGLLQKGLQGAYEFLHHFCLTLKLKELHSQALSLANGHWVGHLGVELLKRTLIVQYWARRTSTKSWIEIGINSGRLKNDMRGTKYMASHLYLKWMKNGKLVTEHQVDFDQVQLSFESILNQVIAQHTNSIFDGIFDGLITSKPYAEGELPLEQESSLVDAFNCKLCVGVSKPHKIQLSCDPVAGTIVISPPTLRSNRLQYELARSKNIVDDFIARFAALRCAIAQTYVLDAIQGTSLHYLAGRKPSAGEVRSRFGPNTLRAAFFSRPGWSSEWTLAASFGRDQDLWWLVYEPNSKTSRPEVHQLSATPIHLQHSLNEEYFESTRRIASAEITMQVSRRALQDKGITVQEITESGAAQLGLTLDDERSLESVDRKIIAWPASSKRISQNNATLLVKVRLRAPKSVLRKLASAGLDPSITVHAEKQLLLLSLSGPVGGNKIDDLLSKLHYIDDLISCIKLVDSVKSLSMQSLTMQDIVISYHVGQGLTLGLRLYFKTAQSKARLQLLPADRNPHNLVSEHINHVLSGPTGPLSDRLRSILCILTATLPLVNSIQYIQGLAPVSDVSRMSALKLEDSRKWIKVHVMSRDMIRFGIHFFALTRDFKKDVELEGTPTKLLVRLEIEASTNESGGKQGWIIRPAVEEFRTYSRPSFTSQALAQRLKEKVFAHTSNKGWLGLGSAALCLFDNPFDLLVTFYQTLTEWVKEEVAKKDETSAPTQVQVQSGKPPMQLQGAGQANLPQSRAQGPNQVPNQKANPGQGQRPFPQGRPAGMQQIPNQSGPSRVMTAQPQQMRQPPNVARGRGQPFQGRGDHLQGQRMGNGGGGTQHDAIQLD